MCHSLFEARPTSSIAIRTFGKKNSFLAESDQHIRHGEQVQPCLMRSHTGPEYLREPGSVSMECSLVHECAAHRVSQEVIQDKPPPHLLPFCIVLRRGNAR